MNCVFDSTADFYDATWFTPVFCYGPAQRFWRLHNLLVSRIFGGFNSIEKSPLSTYFQYFVFRGTSNAGPASLLLQTFKVSQSFRQLVSGWHIFEPLLLLPGESNWVASWGSWMLCAAIIGISWQIHHMSHVYRMLCKWMCVLNHTTVCPSSVLCCIH